MFGFKTKKEAAAEGSVKAGKAKRGKAKASRQHAGPYTPDQRRQAVEAYLKSGMSQKDFAKTWGTSPGSLYNWVKAYQERGPKALDNEIYLSAGKKRGRKGLPAAITDEITAVKQENPDFGTKRVHNFLFRFRGVKVAKGTVRKTLRAADFPPVAQPKRKRRRQTKKKVQRFERAVPMQLWQTDITSLVLTRHSQRVYLTVFIDDHSRYIVSWALQLQQTKEFVMETLLEGINRFGKPEEVLTDQGRQYFSWRGKSDFRKLLRKQGIKHVVARAHHPETVGKCERFWETVQDEFWERVEPQELSEARERLEQYIAHYNHFRPHESLGGMTPADRFFQAEAEIRQRIEETISKNALRLAVGEAPRKPVFLIGQIGDQQISLHGEKGKLLIQTPDGTTRRLDYEDFGHAVKQERAVPTTQNQGDKAHDDESRDERFERNHESGAQAHEEPEAAAADAAGLPGQGALGDGHTRAAQGGARDIDSDDGVLARPNHEAGAGRAPQVDASSNLAAVTAGDIRDDSRATDPAQDTRPKGSQGQRSADAEDEARSGERPEDSSQEDRSDGKDDRDAGSADRGNERDAGLQRCENPNGAPSDGGSGGDTAECSSHEGNQENDESGTDRSSS